MSLIADHLERRGVRFEVLPHEHAYTTIDEARALGLHADEVLKTVVLIVPSGPALAVVPGHLRLSMRLVRAALEEPKARLATEDEIAHYLPEFELGAVPPLPSLLFVPTVVDVEVLNHEMVVFAAGRQRESVRMRCDDLFRGHPVVFAPIAEHPAELEAAAG